MLRELLPALIIGLVVGLAASRASADDRATAQQDFDEGRALLAEGKVAEACPKFAAAARRSQTPGVRLNLADCYSRLGKMASAWANANEALSLAERSGDSAAATVARDQISAIQPKISYLTIALSENPAPPGLEVALDGERLVASAWAAELRVDPGRHEITASAPGRAPCSLEVTVAGDGARVTAWVPVLVGSGSPAASGAPLTPPTDASRPKVQLQRGWSRSTALPLALVGGGLGVVGLGVGAGFGIDALAKKGDYEHQQINGRCIDAQCAALSQKAVSAATISTMGFAAGAALLAAGTVLWLTAPSKSGPNAEAKTVELLPMAGPRSIGAGVSGKF